MAVFTVISRVYDSVTVPKVVTATVREKSVEKTVTGNGTVREKELRFADVVSGLKVETVAVSLGDEVAAGDELYRYSLEDVTEKLGERRMELQKLQLELEKETISGETYGPATQSELAAWELGLAERELEEGKLCLEESRADYLNELERLEKEYYRKLDLTEDELWAQQAQERENARNGVDSAEESRDLAVTEAKRKVEDLEEELKNLEGDEAAQVEKELKRAKEDLEEIQAHWNRQVDDAKDQLDYLSDQRDRIRSGQTSSQEAIRESYEAAVKQQEELWKTQEEKLETLQKNLERAKWNAETAARNDEYTRLTNDQKARLSQLTKKGLELDLEEKGREIAELEALLGNEGKIFSDYSGTVTIQELTEGKETGGQERLGIAVGALVFEGDFEKEDQFLTKGDCIQISIPGTNRRVEAFISNINLLGKETGTFQAELPGLDIPLGTVTGYECRKQSEICQQVIPIEGLRKDMKGYYCLVARTKSGILGEEFEAERVDVELFYQGSTEAAIKGSLSETDPVIIRNSQMIGEGDRVRPVKEL